MKPYLFFDLETTGIDKSTDRIVEIAIIRFDGEKRYEYQTYINPLIPIPVAAIEVHGITDEMVNDKPPFAKVAKLIHNIFTGCDIYGYNSNSFDVPFLITELQRAGFELELKDVNLIDPFVIFKRKEERTLSAALKFYCKREHDGAHGAMSDVLATIDVLEAQKEQYQDLPEDLNLYCNYDKPRADISGNFTIDTDGEYVLNFGKHKGQKAKNCILYLKWMSCQDFMPDTKKIINLFIN